jgi:protein SERAC1
MNFTWFRFESGPYKTLWPRDLLSNDFPGARIVAFGYDADIVKIWSLSPAGSNGLRNHGEALAYAIANLSLTPASLTRPIIFIANSLGGLVVEQALLLCRSSNNPRLAAVLAAVYGIIFMATPHGGSMLASWGCIIAKYLQRVRSLNRKCLASVEQDCQRLLHSVGHEYRYSNTNCNYYSRIN